MVTLTFVRKPRPPLLCIYLTQGSKEMALLLVPCFPERRRASGVAAVPSRGHLASL